MKICFDGIGISHFKNTSLYSHTVELLNDLSTMYPQSEYKVVSNKETLSNPLKNRKIDFIEMNINRKKNDYSILEKYIIDNKINIYHSLNNGFSIPSNKVCKYVLTIDTLLPFSYPQYVDRKFFNKFNKVVPHALENSDKIIAVSKFIKSELISYFNIPEKKIIVIYPSISKIFKPLSKERCKAILKSKYKIDGNFLLFSGSIHIRKNLSFLLKSFKAVSHYYNSLNLVIVGDYKNKRQTYYLKLKEYAKRLGMDDRVIFTGSVEYTDMPYFYNSALCAINISDYEGFPMSSVEALACNTPVICSNSSSFREVLCESAIYVNSNNFDELKNALVEAIRKNDDETENRLSNIKEYSSEKSIREHVRVYESII